MIRPVRAITSLDLHTPPGWVARFLRQPGGRVGAALGLALLVVAVCAEQIAPANPKLAVAGPLLPPSSAHWFGTDDLGRDVFSNVVYGSRVALYVGLVAAATSALIGTAVGLIAGYKGGPVDDLLMRLSEVFQLLPRFFLALLLVSLFGSEIGWVALLLGFTFWPTTARLLRSRVLSVREKEFVVAAQAIGATDLHIMFRQVLPNAVSPILINSARQIAGAILTEASLSFLGMGDPTLVSWGQMLNNAQRFIRVAWWLFVFPGAALVGAVLCTTLIADGLVDTLQPSRLGNRRDPEPAPRAQGPAT